MEFNYIAGRYYESTRDFKVFGGFPSLKDAKDFLEMKEWNFLSSGFMFVSAPEGIYVHGEESRISNHLKWFTPEEIRQDKAYLYSPRKDENVKIDNLLPYDTYRKLQSGDVFETQAQEHTKTSVIERLVENKDKMKQKDSEKNEDMSFAQLLHDERSDR